MARYAYRIVNVFARSALEGNPLCVFEDGRGLDTATMQALALQFNLSETSFILPATQDGATALMRIFTPAYEMPFAGHPSLGTASVVSDLTGCGDALTLECGAGLVPLTAKGNAFRLKAPAPPRPPSRAFDGGKALAARLLSLDESDIIGDPLWVDTGSEQLMVPVATPEAVKKARPDSSLLDIWPKNRLGARMAYPFALLGEKQGVKQVLSRFFFSKGSDGVAEDPGTGSACANLGGWFILRDAGLPVTAHIAQGEQTGRPCHLTLEVDADGGIFVGGEVIELGRGYVEL